MGMSQLDNHWQDDGQPLQPPGQGIKDQCSTDDDESPRKRVGQVTEEERGENSLDYERDQVLRQQQKVEEEDERRYEENLRLCTQGLYISVYGDPTYSERHDEFKRYHKILSDPKVLTVRKKKVLKELGWWGQSSDGR